MEDSVGEEWKQLHVVMFPWLAFGHIIPFMELSKLLAEKGHRVSFVSTPRNIDRLPELPPSLAHLFTFVALPLPRVAHLPPDAEATTDLPLDEVPYLKLAFDGLQTDLTLFLRAASPDWIIYDFTPHWLPPVAAQLGISRAYFSIFNASSVAFFGSATAMLDRSDGRAKPEDYTVPPEWVPFPTTLAFRLHEIRRFFDSFKTNVSGAADWYRYAKAVIGCDAFLIRSCRETEADWLENLRELNQKPVLPVGLLPPSAQDNHRGGAHTWDAIGAWLDRQDKGSVVYVALGTEVTPSREDLTELSLGLELSGLPFFWALRKRHGSEESDSFQLPQGFEERTRGRGMVWTSWAPQVRILGHDSVGSFVTHCGWSSIIEGLQHGRPLLMLPYLGDQGLNARFFTEKEVGMEIPRDEQDGSMARDSVAHSLRLVTVEESGRVYREKAKEMGAIFGNKQLHDKYIDGLVEYLHRHSRLTAAV